MVKDKNNENPMVALMSRSEVVEWLNKKCKPTAADIVDSIPTTYYITKDDTEYCHKEDLRKLLNPMLVLEMECDVVTTLIPKKHVHFTGVEI